MSGVGRGVRTLHQCLQLHQRRITSFLSRAPRPPPLQLVLPRPPPAITTTTGSTRIRTNPTAILPVTFLPNIVPTGLPIIPFSRAFIALISSKPRFHPFFYIF